MKQLLFISAACLIITSSVDGARCMRASNYKEIEDPKAAAIRKHIQQASLLLAHENKQREQREADARKQLIIAARLARKSPEKALDLYYAIAEAIISPGLHEQAIKAIRRLENQSPLNI